MIILDTNVLSELRLPDCDRNVAAFIAAAGSDDLAIAAATVSEVAYGAAMLEQRGSPRGAAMQQWLDGLLATYRVVPMDAPAARMHGRLLAIPALQGFAVTHPGARQPRFGADLAIAAVAAVNDAVVATRGTDDFGRIARHCPGLRVIDPFLPTAR